MEWVLEAGDILYLPPNWAHDGVALGADCITASVGLRAPSRLELADALLPRLLDPEDEPTASAAAALHRRWHRAQCRTPAAIPEAFQDFTLDALQRVLAATARPWRVRWAST